MFCCSEPKFPSQLMFMFVVILLCIKFHQPQSSSSILNCTSKVHCSFNFRWYNWLFCLGRFSRHNLFVSLHCCLREHMVGDRKKNRSSFWVINITVVLLGSRDRASNCVTRLLKEFEAKGIEAMEIGNSGGFLKRSCDYLKLWAGRHWNNSFWYWVIPSSDQSILCLECSIQGALMFPLLSSTWGLTGSRKVERITSWLESTFALVLVQSYLDTDSVTVLEVPSEVRTQNNINAGVW